MKLETAFLDCNIWSVQPEPAIIDGFFLVENIYQYNSLTSGIIVFNPSSIQIPEFEIRNFNLLDGLNIDFINKHRIPLIYRDKDFWTIDLRIYNAQNFNM